MPLLVSKFARSFMLHHQIPLNSGCYQNAGISNAWCIAMAESCVHLAGKRSLVSNVWLDEEGAVAGLRAGNDLASLMGLIDVARSLHVTVSRDSCCVRGAGSRSIQQAVERLSAIRGSDPCCMRVAPCFLLQKHSLFHDLAVRIF